MESSRRPWMVNGSAWLVIGSTMLFLIVQLLGFAVRANLEGLIFLLVGLVFWGARLGLGIAIRKGLNWARVTYLIFDLLIVNAALFGEGSSSLPSQTAWVIHLRWIPILLYLAALVFLTRPAALAYFGRPKIMWMKAGYVILALILISVVVSGASSLAYRLGATRLPAVSDYLNPANLFRNLLAENPSLSFLETGHYREVRAIDQAIQRSKSLEELGRATSSGTYREMKWVADNNVLVFGVFLVSVLGVILILRHP